MKYFVVFLTLIGFTALFLFGDDAYGLWIPLSSEKLIEQSGTIFVGNITAIANVEVEYLSQIARNGTIKQSVGPEVMTLEEYTVHVERFLQNPQDSDAVKLLQATVSGVPGGPAKISGFKVGDRVLFYVPKNENQTHFQGQHLPESFKIPQYCDAQSVLDEPTRISEGPFIATQDGVKKQREFTASIPIQFSYQKNVGLTGKGFDVLVSIVREDENGDEIVFDQKVHAESEPCKWLATAEWEIVPVEGKYRMSIGIIEDGGGMGLYTNFVVKNGSSASKSPLQQFRAGIPIDKIQCKNDSHVLVKRPNGKIACVYPLIAEKLDWKMINADSTMTPSIFEVPKDGRIFDVEYDIKGGVVKNMVFSNKTNSLWVTIDSTDKGSLILNIPRNLVDAKLDYCPPQKINPPDDKFFVLLDSEEIPYDEIQTTPEKRTLQIQFASNSTKIEIIGTCLI